MSNFVGIPVNVNIVDLYSKLFGYVGAPFPFLDKDFSSVLSRFNTPGQIINVINSLKSSPGGFKEIMHVSLGADEITGTDNWKFPYQPLISIKGGNKIVRRFPNTPSETLRGSIKERWSEDDDLITLKGVFLEPAYRSSNLPTEPKQDFDEGIISGIEMLQEFKRNRGSVRIQNRLLELLGITHLAIETAELVEYSSTRVRPFVVRGYSDYESYDLLEG